MVLNKVAEVEYATHSINKMVEEMERTIRLRGICWETPFRHNMCASTRILAQV